MSSDLAPLMVPVAERLWGPPKSRSPGEFRYSAGRTVNPRKGVWFDFQAGEKVGGGPVDLVKHELKCDTRGAFEWLRANGFDVGPDPRANGASHPTPTHAAHHDSPPAPAAKPRIAATYDYTDEHGRLVYQVCRLEDGTIDPDTGKPRKTFGQRRPDGQGGWVWNLQGVQPTIFRLPEIQEAVAQDNVVFVVEGEKCVEALAELGVPATCNSGGAGKWRPEFAEHLRGADVVVIPDNDPQARDRNGDLKFHSNGRPVIPGMDHALAVVESLRGIARRVRLLEIPDLPSKGDVFDWVRAGGTVESLYDMAGRAPEPGKEAYVSTFKAIRFADIDLPGSEHRWLVKNVLTIGERSLLVGPSQSGKSFVAIDLAMAIARGQSWFGQRVEPGLVVYQAGEGGVGLKKRLRAYREHHGIAPGTDLPFVLLPTRIDLYADEEAVPRIVKEALHWSEQYPESPLRLIVIDTFSTATPAADENSARDMSLVLDRCQKIAERCNAAVLLVHHMNADGTKPRGHTSIFANVDSAIICQRTEELDDDKRHIRTASVVKQKDGVDGLQWKFVLKQIDLGRDEHEDPVSSCVCVEPQGSHEVKPDFSTFTTDMRDVFAMVKKAVFENGMATPGGLNLPRSIVTVSTLKAVLDLYMKNIKIVDESAPEIDQKRAYEAARKSLQRGSADLAHRGYIGREGKWIWLTGKEPSGRTAAAGGKKPRPGFNSGSSRLPSDIGDFVP